MSDIPEDIRAAAKRIVGEGCWGSMIAYRWLEKLEAEFATALLAERNANAERIAALEAERDAARDAFDKLAEPSMKSMKFENGEFNIQLTGPAVNHVAATMVGHFKALGAENYFELSLYDRDEPYQRYVVTVQKAGAKSPHELRVAAEEALVAERNATIERCAKVAEGKDRNVMWTPAEIAAAIRSQAKDHP